MADPIVRLRITATKAPVDTPDAGVIPPPPVEDVLVDLEIPPRLVQQIANNLAKYLARVTPTGR